MFLGGHDEVVRFVLVVDNVLQVDASFAAEIFEEFLVEDERHAGYFFDPRLRFRVPVHEVGCYGDRQSPSELFAFET